MSVVVVRFVGDTANIDRALAKTAAEAEVAGVKMKSSMEKFNPNDLISKWHNLGSEISNTVNRAAKGAVLAIGAIGVASVVSAAKFQQSMELLHTQAGVAQGQIQALTKDVLALAPTVGTGPDALAESLFHIESTINKALPPAEQMSQAMDRLKVAAMGAKVGNADLTDVTNALNATVASGISGTKDLGSAMGALNAIVGAGDMHMQDLADAMGTGVLAVVKGYGVGLTDAGAALATFGDNNIRGADAATMLRMSVQSLTVGTPKAAKMLGELGLKSDSLAKEMQQHGLSGAMDLLVTKMDKAGVTGPKVGQFLTEAFGKKAGPGLAVLVSQFARFQSKMEEVQKGAGTFGDAWQKTTKTLAFQVSQITTQFKAWADEIGLRLIPYVQLAITWIETHRQQVQKLAELIAGVLVVAIAAWVASMAPVIIATVAIGGAVTALVAVVEHLYATQAWFRDAVTVSWDSIKLDIVVAIGIITKTWEAFSWAVQVQWNSYIKPTLKALASTWLVLMNDMINGAAKAFGWIPGIGPKLQKAAADFNQFTYDVNGALGNIVGYKHITIAVDMIAGSRASDLSSNMTAGKIAGAKAAGLAAVAAAAKKTGAAIPQAIASGISGGSGGGGGSKSNPIADALKQGVQTALTKVQDLKKQMADAGKQIADGLVSGIGGVTEAFKQQHGTISDFVLGKGLVQQSEGGWIAGQMQTKAAQMVAFAGKIKQLQKMGLNGATLAEVVNAGADTGSQMADALLSDRSVVASINSSEATIQSAAGAIGTDMAGATYLPQILAAIKTLVQLQHESPAQYAKAQTALAAAAQIRARTVTG